MKTSTVLFTVIRKRINEGTEITQNEEDVRHILLVINQIRKLFIFLYGSYILYFGLLAEILGEVHAGEVEEIAQRRNGLHQA